MASKVDIVNWALGFIGEDEVDSLTESSVARKCGQFYPLALRALLGEHNWRFATKTESLALSTDTPHSWSYRYALPADYIESIELATSGDEILAYEVVGDNKLDTDEAPAYLKYVYFIDDPNKYTSQFIEVFAIKLAIAIDTPLTGGANLDKLMKLYSFYLPKAKTANRSAGKNSRKAPEQQSDFLKARN